MAKSNWIAGKKFAKKAYSTRNVSELAAIKNSYINKFYNCEFYSTILSERTLTNRRDFYCGVIDYLNSLLRK